MISADFPGEASKYIEELFDGKTARSSQVRPATRIRVSGTLRASTYAPRMWIRRRRWSNADPSRGPTAQGFNVAAAGSSRQPIPPEKMEAYRALRTGAYAVMLGR